jgi:NAD(P)-dependent dehydrogenase (short-subunit alcohol dehydrogenase family)
MDLSGKTVIVTGASKGIGAAIATAMVAAGAKVIAHYGSDRAGAEAAVAGPRRGRRRLIRPTCRTWRRSTASGRRPAPMGPDRRAGEQRRDHAADGRDRGRDRGLGPRLGRGDGGERPRARAADAPRGARTGWRPGAAAASIGIGSWVSTRGTSNPGAIAYAASKAAIAAATKTVARNYAKGILAYVIAPGVVRHADVRGKRRALRRRRGRHGRPADGGMGAALGHRRGLRCSSRAAAPGI